MDQLGLQKYQSKISRTGKTTFWGFLFITMLVAQSCSNSDSQKNEPQTVDWELNDTTEVGSVTPELLGAPQVVSDSIMGTAIKFNGQDDGLIIPKNPVKGMQKFTVEVFFKPASGGTEEQRFVHFQDDNDNRGLIEIRLNPGDKWSLDTFLYNSKADSGLTLLDREIEHPCDQWYWAALTYGGTTMKHYVNGQKELEGNIDFRPMVEGRTSLGVRLNKVYWFKGMIKEIHFYPKVLEASELQAVGK